MLETVLQYGTGKAAAIGQFAAGKTGTTSNYGDAWFVGWDSKYTVAVWVGYPNSLVPMTTAFDGGPVLGGTFPALIWHDFMVSALRDRQDARRRSRHTQQKGQVGRIGRRRNDERARTLRRAAERRIGHKHRHGRRLGRRRREQGRHQALDAEHGRRSRRRRAATAAPAPRRPKRPRRPAPAEPSAPAAPSAPSPSAPPASSSSPTGGVSPGG